MSDQTGFVTPRVELGNFLFEPSERTLAMVAAVAHYGDRRQCVDEVTAYALQFVCKIMPAWMYGREDARHLFIHPQSVSAELVRHQKYLEKIDALDRFERANFPFAFEYNGETASLYALQKLLAEHKRTSLLSDPLVDSIYMPIYYGNHCSMLVLSLPRRIFVHFDSVRCQLHVERAQLIVNMFLAAKLFPPFMVGVMLPLAQTQSETWECGWCAILFANWWREAGAGANMEDVRRVLIGYPEVAALARKILEAHGKRAPLLQYSQRLELAFGILRSGDGAKRR